MALFPIPTKGIRLKGERNTAAQSIVPIALPRELHIAMRQGNCEAALPVVSTGDYVKLGQLIGRNASPLSVPVHSSASGRVAAIKREPSQLGGDDLHIVIETDGRQSIADSVRPPRINSPTEFLAAVLVSGMVGLGGAGFPMAAKFAPCLKVEVDTLIINGVECEPFLTVDRVTMLAHAGDVVAGARAIMQWLGIRRAVICVARSMKKVHELFSEMLKGDESIKVKSISDIYPYGSERILIKQVTGRKLIPGRIPADVGCLVCNVNSVVKLQHYLATGLPLVSKNVTVDGSAVSYGRNLEIPVGTRISDVLAFCGGAADGKEPEMILLDGVMMGKKVPDASYPIIKMNNAVLFFDRDFAESLGETPCINCGRCLRSCSLSLVPVKIADALKRSDMRTAKALGAEICNNCGACSYVCPARRRLSSVIYEAGQRIKNERTGADNERK
ncbi:MAG TPA: RnfABCDGE type electron transport complex subunit C [Bacillota bacterium]|nr:RnfABCDGE type electron transport complex subunit C [Bacillota bacterium]